MTDLGVENEPTAAYLVSLIGGIIGIISSFILIGTGAWIGSLTNEFITYSGPSLASLWGLGIWGLIASAIIIVSAVNLKSNPWEHTKWGVIILVFSIIGLNSIVGLIGGVLALVYEPKESVPYHLPAEAPKRFCPNCGRIVKEGTKFCPYCGSQVGP
jgi:hypothetical protein